MVISTTSPPVSTSAATSAPAPLELLCTQVQQRLQQFRQAPLTPLATQSLEQDLKALFDAAGRALLAEEFNRQEPAAKAEAPAKVRYQGASYRINKKTKATIGTSFGPITLWSFLYLHEDDGEPGLHPLHVLLGVAAGATPVLAERVAGWAVTHSQREVRALLAAEHGLYWSNDKLRAVLRAFRRGVARYREQAQVQRLLGWLAQAEQSRGRHRPVLAVGRDGIMVPMRGLGYQEASVATVSVYDRRGRRLGTMYLGQMPEKGQGTLSAQLTAVIEQVLQRCSGHAPRLVYVTDKGQAPEDYYRRVLRQLRDPRRPGQRLSWEWVLDFFHVCGYVGKLAAALFGDRGQRWFKRMRHWLRERRQGVSNILRSALQHYQRRRLSQQARQEFWKAYRYLRRHRRYMAYGQYRRQGLPIGSGVTEAACKTVFTERLKRSGMRWERESGQVIVDLRVLKLSGIWQEVVQRELRGRSLPQVVSSRSRPRRKARFAA